jgi:hypothetical protein
MNYQESFINYSELAAGVNLKRLSNALRNLSNIGNNGNSRIATNDFDLYLDMSKTAIKQKDEKLSELICQMVLSKF